MIQNGIEIFFFLIDMIFRGKGQVKKYEYVYIFLIFPLVNYTYQGKK